MRVIDTINLSVTSRCNLSCPNCCCAIPWRKGKADYDWTYFENAARVFPGMYRINLTGGEPTLHHDFPRIAREFRNLFRCELLTMETNGWGLDRYEGDLSHFDLVSVTMYDKSIAPTIDRLRQHYPAKIVANPVNHQSRKRTGSGTCHRATGRAVSYWSGLIYPCCIGPGVEWATGIIPSENWKQDIQTTPMPCGKCWFAGSEK